jgi:hypothetical protein
MNQVRVQVFTELPTELQAFIIDAFKASYASGQLGTEAAIEGQGRELAKTRGYLWKPSRRWIQTMKKTCLGIAKRPYR